MPVIASRMKAKRSPTGFFTRVLVLTPQQVLARARNLQHILDQYPDPGDLDKVRRFHVCELTLWTVAENKDGQFWTNSSNEDELFPDLKSAVEWLRERGGAEEATHAKPESIS